MRACAVLLLGAASGCATLGRTDPLAVGVAGIEPLPGEGLELRLAVTIRVQNPNDAPVEYTGAARVNDPARRAPAPRGSPRARPKPA
jgi:hypothetical protein